MCKHTQVRRLQITKCNIKTGDKKHGSNTPTPKCSKKQEKQNSTERSYPGVSVIDQIVGDTLQRL